MKGITYWKAAGFHEPDINPSLDLSLTRDREALLTGEDKDFQRQQGAIADGI